MLVEAGMGGREDSTNVVNPIVSVITSIALEHTNFLGTTFASIAAHKAGIIKQGRPVILGEVPQEVQFIFEKEAQLKNTSIEQYGREFRVLQAAQGESYTHIKRDFSLEQLSRQFLGAHQGKNMALAITAFLQVLQAFDLPMDALKINQAISKAKLSGRFEQVLPNVYFDGAHNPASIEMLVQTIQQQFPSQKIEFVVGLLADKDVDTILAMLEQVSETFYFVDMDNPRAMPAQQLLEKSNANEKSIVQNIDSLLRTPTKSGKVQIVTGSLYLLSEIRQKITLL